jgi:ABC-type uncharacterized transport system substrate-binding protein
MLVRLSIIGAFAAILMLPTTLSAQVNPGGAGLFYDIATYVQRLAGGAKPSDMPIEQSPRFYMAINLKTAASLGVSLSDVFIARANEVRE